MRRLTLWILICTLLFALAASAQNTDIDLPEMDSADAITDSELVMFFDASTGAIRAQQASDVRDYAQVGVTVDVSGKLDADLSNLGTVSANDKLAFRTELEAMKTDMANIDTSTTPLPNASDIRAALGLTESAADKLDRDLDNVDATAAEKAAFLLEVGALARNLQNVPTDLTAIEKNAFRSFVDIMDVRGANLVTGLSLAERAAFRGKISAAVGPVVFPDENSTVNVSLLEDQVIHFTNTGNTYLAVNDVLSIQFNQIRNDQVNFRQIHLPHVTAAEINAGTEPGARAMGVTDIISIINTHKPTIDYPALMGEPFIYVAPGDALPTPTAANSIFLVVAGTAQGRIIYHQSIQHGSALSVTYREFNSTDLSSGNYRGEVNYIENLPSDASDGDVYFVRSSHALRIWNDTASEWGNVFWAGNEYLGNFVSKEAADEAVAAHYPSSGTPSNAVGKHLSYGAPNQADLYTITAYTAAAPDVRTWTPIFNDAGTDLITVDDYDANAIQFIINDESDIAWHGIPSVLNELGLEPASIRNIVAPMFTHQSANYAYDMGTGRITTTFPEGGSGTTVTANPGGDSNTDLTSIGIAGTNYDIPSGSGEENVQADWTEINTLSDAYIQNKPIVYDAEGIRDTAQAMWTQDEVDCSDGTNTCTITFPSGGTPDYDSVTGRPFIVVASGETRPAATDSNTGMFLIDFNVGRIYINVLHAGHDATFTASQFTTANLRARVSNNSVTYRGVRQTHSALPTGNDVAHDDVYYVLDEDRFVVYDTNLYRTLPVTNHVQGFFTTKGAAEHALGTLVGSGTGTGYVVAYDSQNVLRSQAEVWYTTAYTAPVADSRVWADWQAGLVSAIGRKVEVIGDPADGQVPVWDADDGQWQPGDAAASGDGGNRTEVGSVSIADDDTVYSVTLSPAVGVNHQIEIEYGTTTASRLAVYAEVSSDAILGLNHQSTTPTNGNNAVGLKVARITDTGLTTFGHGTLFLWKGNDSSSELTTLYVAISHETSPDADMKIYARPLGGGGGGGAADGVAESVDLSVSGSDLTIDIVRSNSLATISDTVTLPAGSGTGEENVQADWTETDTSSDAYIQNKPEIVTGTPGTGDGGKLPTVSAADIRYVNASGDTVSGALRVGSIVGTGGGDTITQFGTGAEHDVGTGSGQLAELESAGNFHPRRLANNTPDALATDVQFLSNNTATTARWRDLDGYVNDFAGALLATLTEFAYDDSNDTLTFSGGGSSFNFSANPGGSGLTDLTTATFGATSYDIGDTTAINAVSADSDGLDFTQRNGGTVELSRANLRTSLGVSTTPTTGNIPATTGNSRLNQGWLGSGTANNSRLLRGDGAWVVPTEIMQDVIGTWLASLDEFTYDDAGNDIEIDISGDLDDITTSDHYKGAYDEDETYEFGNVVSHSDAFWIVNDATKANANEPEPPVETTGWLQLSDEASYRGSFDADDTDTFTFHTGDTLTIPGEGFFFCTTAGDYAPQDIPDSLFWTIFLHQSVVTSGNIINAVSGTPVEHSVIVYDDPPDHRLEWRSPSEMQTILGTEIVLGEDDTAFDDNSNQRRVTLTVAGRTSSAEGERYIFPWDDDDFTPATQQISIRVGSETAQRVRWIIASTGNEGYVTLGDLTEDNVYEVFRSAAGEWHLIGGTREQNHTVGTHINAVSVDGADDGLDFTQVNSGTINITRANLYEALGVTVTAQANRIPQLNSSGFLASAMIDSLAASQISSGIFTPARLASGGSDNDVLTRTASGMAWETPSTLTQTTADGRYLRLNPSGTTTRQTVQDPVTIDVSGNQEAFVIEATEAGSSAIFKITTNSSGSQKAFQANRTGQSLAFMEFGGATGGEGKAGIAIGSGTGGRDTNLYRDASNMLKTNDSFTVGDDLIVEDDFTVNSGGVISLPDNSVDGADLTHNSVGTDELEANSVRLDEMAHRSSDAGDIIGYDSAGAPEAKRPDFIIPAQSAAPASPPQGAMYYDTDDDALMTYDGSNWNEVGGSPLGTEMTWTRAADFANQRAYHTDITIPTTGWTIMMFQPIQVTEDNNNGLNSGGIIFKTVWDAIPDVMLLDNAAIGDNQHDFFVHPMINGVGSSSQFFIGHTSAELVVVGIRGITTQTSAVYG